MNLQQLEEHLWRAADILRGSLDANEYRQPIMTIMFLKRLNDQFEEYERHNSKHKSFKNKLIFLLPENTRWKNIKKLETDIGQHLDQLCSDIESKNSELEGVLTNTSFKDKRRYPDYLLKDLIEHFDKKQLGDSNLTNEDIFGRAYEYLLQQFADSAGKKAGEFFTPREVVNLLVKILEPKDNMMICDPTCGSGGMLIWSHMHVKEKEGDPQNLELHGQERNFGNYSMCKMNMILHGVKNFKIVHENVLSTPLLVNNNKLMKYDLVFANFPFSMEWNDSIAKNDLYNRFVFGVPPKKYADFAFIQHIYSTLNSKGKAAIISAQGILFRPNKEAKIRKQFVESDSIESIIALPANLFFGTGIPACIFILNKNKPKNRKNKIIFIYGANDFLEGGKRDYLREEDIIKIKTAFSDFKDIKKYAHVASIEEIRENEYNLNVARYVDISEPFPEIDIQQTLNKIDMLKTETQEVETRLRQLLLKLNLHYNHD